MHTQKQTAACRSLHNNRDGSAQTSQQTGSYAELQQAYTLMAASRMLSEASWLTNKERNKARHGYNQWPMPYTTYAKTQAKHGAKPIKSH